MINLFPVNVSDDKSLVYLNQIFGSVNGIIVSPEGPAAGTTINVLGAMFQYFNTIVLAIGALLVVYVTVVGVMATAHEGEFMGKKWNNIWIPIRTVLGIAALVPMGGGYSAIQMIMMWIIVQGIGAADGLWGVLLAGVQTTGSIYANATIPTTGTYTTFALLFEGLVCDQSARMQKSDPTNTAGGGYFCSDSGSGWCNNDSVSFNPNSSSMSLGPGGVCGTFKYCNPSSCNDQNSLACVACSSQSTALASVVPVLIGIAKQFVKVDYDYRDFFANSAQDTNNSDWSWIYSYCQANGISQDECCVPDDDDDSNGKKGGGDNGGGGDKDKKGKCKASKGSGAGNATFPGLNANNDPQNASDQAVTNLYLPYALNSTIQNSDFISSATDQYTAILSTNVNAWIIQQGNDPNKQIKGDLADAQSTGWIFAGAYYYAVSQMNNNNLKDALPDMSFDVQTISEGTMANYRNNFQAANTLVNAVSGASGDDSGDGSGGSNNSNSNNNASMKVPKFSSLMVPLSTAINGVKGVVSNNLTSAKSKAGSTSAPPNPLVQLQSAGMALLEIASILFLAFIVITVVLAIFANIDVWVLGTGGINPMGPGLAIFLFMFLPAFFGFLGILITVGALLGVYTPLIPYVVFTMGAIGWMISVMETMVAGPLVALGILSPSGQHELLGKAEPALMLMLNVFLRPTLMIFGLAAAMLLAGVVVQMINYAFWSTVASGIGGKGGAGIWTDPLELIIFLGAYIALIVAALNKCFAAIYLIPEKVIRWIGGQPESYGEGEALGEVKRGTESTAAGVKGGADQTSYQQKQFKAGNKKKWDQKKSGGGVEGK